MESVQYACPACAQPLIRELGPDGIVLVCPSCAKRLVNLPSLKKVTDPAYSYQLRMEAKEKGTATGGHCPYCTNPMTVLAKDGLSYQFCFFCEMIWLGDAERALFPPPPPVGGAAALTPQAAEYIARVDQKLARAQEDKAPSSQKDWIFWVLGLPTTPGGRSWNVFPWMTVTIAGVVLLCSFFLTNTLNGFALGSYPMGLLMHRPPFENILYWLQFPVSNLWLNVYLLVLFGAVVENQIGPYGLLSIFISPSVVTLFLAVFHVFYRGWYLTVGGGVVAVMIFYAMAFPRRRIHWMFTSYQAAYLITAWVLFELFATGIPFWGYGVGVSTPLLGTLTGWACWFYWGTKMPTDWSEE